MKRLLRILMAISLAGLLLVSCSSKDEKKIKVGSQEKKGESEVGRSAVGSRSRQFLPFFTLPFFHCRIIPLSNNRIS